MDLRTSDSRVRAVIDFDSSLNTAPFIRTANRLTDKVSAADSGGELGTELLLEIETYLAAHLCAQRDPQYSSKSTGGASGQFQGQFGQRLDATSWGQTALMLDVTGYLAKLNEGKRSKASLTWVGKPPSEQTNIEDRD